MKHECAIHWFATGLRLGDNPALLRAATLAKNVFPVFCVDPHFTAQGPKYACGVNRYRHLIETLADLDASLRACGSRLLVARGKPADVLPQLARQFSATLLSFERDSSTPFARDREAAVRAALGDGVTVVSEVSHTLYDPERLLQLGDVTTTYSAFLKLLSKAGAVPTPVAAPTDFGALSAADGADPAGKDWALPTLDEAGFSAADIAAVDTPSPFPGGEHEARRRMDDFLADAARVCAFSKPQTAPTALTPSTTVLSPYLKFGSLSPRVFWHAIHSAAAKGRSRTRPPVSLDGQLLWREFYYFVATHTPHYARMRGNPICRQIAWDEPAESSEARARLDAWAHARTGYPWIDAAMTQLRRTGWMHHLARHAVACFLTRGDLWVSWEAGARVFEELLLDADPALNAGNWMWLSCSCFYYQYFKCYSPVSFPQKTDKAGAYIRHWLPQLSRLPDKYIYAPWTAPLAVQRAAGCVVGTDYPRPIIDHAAALAANKGKMAKAYDAHKRRVAGDVATSGGGAKKKAARQATLKLVVKRERPAAKAEAAPGVQVKQEEEGPGSARKKVRRGATSS